MDAFVWDQHFVTGLADVDEQHHGLVDLFNELSQTLFTSQGSAAPVDADALLQGVFQRLVRYAQFHFADEENLMHRLGMDPRHIQVHQERHQEFVQQLHALWSTRASMAAPAESFASFLTGWLGLHILGIDQSMSRQLAAMEQGASAQQAYERELAAHDNGSTQVLLKMIGKLYQVLSAQNNALAEANQSLEARVARRTRALAQANSELQQANVRLEAFGRTDGLLQIANRGYFDDRLAHAGASAHRHRQPLGLLMIDVDEFKRYNDHFDHQAGDACLQAVARAVQGSLQRATDLLARYGGEELAVILPDVDAEGAATVAARVVASVAALALPHPASGAAACVTVSVGVAARVPSMPLQGSLAALVADADAALYRAKASGRNRSCLAVAQK